MICEIVGYDPAKIIYDTTKFSGVSKKVFNTEKIQRLFHFKFTDIMWRLARNDPLLSVVAPKPLSSTTL